MKRFDERDIMFARMSWKEGSESQEDYYRRNPDKKEIDNRLKKLPGLMSEETPTYDKLNSSLIDATFGFLGDIKKFAEGKVNKTKKEVHPPEITEKLKEIAGYYGADLVGIAEIGDDFYYSHRGREERNYGDKPQEMHKYAIAFAVELEEENINTAPYSMQTVETTRGYVKCAVIGMILSYFIRDLGYDARNHMDGNYLLPVCQVAEEAGIGEIGRIGLLLTEEYGPRVRIGVVTTDMELIPDKKISREAREFCKTCGKCAEKCPGRAISGGGPSVSDDKEYWKVDQEKCFEMWMRLGTDCGICLKTCPYGESDKE